LRSGGRLAIAVHAWVAKHAKDRGNPDRPSDEHIADALRTTAFSDVSLAQVVPSRGERST